MSIISNHLRKMLVAALLATALAGCAATDTSRATGEYIDDTVITAKVNAALAEDPVTSAVQVNVETYRGIVQLSGFVDTEEAQERAVELAEQIEGVEEVRNALQVRGAS